MLPTLEVAFMIMVSTFVMGLLDMASVVLLGVCLPLTLRCRRWLKDGEHNFQPGRMDAVLQIEFLVRTNKSKGSEL